VEAPLAWREALAGIGGRKRGIFGESIGPVDNVPSDAPLDGNRKCTDFAPIFVGF
jgi:hypothetical protein